MLSSALLILEHYFIALVGFISFLSYEKRGAMYVADTGQRYTRVSHAHNTKREINNMASHPRTQGPCSL